MGWDGNRFYTDQHPDGCGCYWQVAALAGTYRLRARVYLSENDWLHGNAAYTVEVDFTLPDPDGQVQVSLANPS